jgi:Spy/CpxP family protein refolding chaperone
MKTKPLALTLALLSAFTPLAAQQPAPPASGPQSEQRGPDQNRRPGQPGNPTPREGRGEMNQPSPGGRGPQNQPPHADPFAENFFPPELIMHHQHALNLADDQRKRLIDIVQKAQPQFTELQWQLESEQSNLMSLMRTERPDEKQISSQLDKVLKLEGEMKRGQLLMFVRLKNELSAEQQMKLKEAMRRQWQGGPGPGPAGMQPSPRPQGAQR